LIHITHFFCGGVGWGGGEVGAIHFLLGTESLLVMDCECNNTLVCTLVASAQIFLFFYFFRNDENFKNNFPSMENNIFYEKENEEFLEYSIFELESSNLFIYLFDRHVLKPPLYYGYSIT
jgi:hypothetical protein